MQFFFTFHCNYFFFQKAEREVVWVMRAAILVVATAAVLMAITVRSVYSLFFLCSDFIYVVLFPQLLCAVHIPYTNYMGSAFGFVLGIFFRFAGGDSLLNLPVLIEYPYYIDGVQYFPYKTLSMLISLSSILLFSIPYNLYLKSKLPADPEITSMHKLPDENEHSYDSGSQTFQLKESDIIDDRKIS